MSVSSITQAYSQYAQQAAANTSTGGPQSSVDSAVQEATESKAQTAREAKSGDRVAIRKLARQNLQSPAAPSTPSTPPTPAPSEVGKGDVVDHKA